MISERFVLALACLVGSAASVAQSQEAIPDWQQSHLEEANPGVRALYSLAVCARHERRSAVEALLATPIGSADEERLLPILIPSRTRCPIRTTQVRFSPNFVRGAVAEAVYNFDRVRPRDNTALPFTERFEPSPVNSSINVGRWVARCAVHRSPQLAHEVVRFNPGAVGERRALVALRSVFADCLPPGERLTVQRLRFRGLIAEALYHASRAFPASFTVAAPGR